VGREIRYVEAKKSKGKGKKEEKKEEGAGGHKVIDHIIDRFEGCVRA
jgi:hypothetical protein